MKSRLVKTDIEAHLQQIYLAAQLALGIIDNHWRKPHDADEAAVDDALYNIMKIADSNMIDDSAALQKYLKILKEHTPYTNYQISDHIYVIQRELAAIRKVEAHELQNPAEPQKTTDSALINIAAACMLFATVFICKNSQQIQTQPPEMSVDQLEQSTSAADKAYFADLLKNAPKQR